jgi:oligoribonuclease NrnB/cAMP/cGMP phosphodiesterase (DHH superfamily)
MNEELKDIVVIYHKNCPDGFASAWAAWKKFGDSASYRPASYGDLAPEGTEGKEVYVVDFSYTAEQLPILESRAGKLVVIDHHKGGELHVKATKEYVFDLNHSGAYLAWQYFHPSTKIPDFIEYLSDGDINIYTKPDAHSICTYICSTPKMFENFDVIYSEMEDKEKRPGVVEKGELLERYKDFILEPAINSIHFINLAGTVVPAVNCVFPMDEKSDLIHRMYDLYPPVAMSYRYDEGEWKCSLRSNGDFDCTALAGKFGGSGHKGSSGFAIKAEPGVFPFSIVENPYNKE